MHYSTEAFEREWTLTFVAVNNYKKQVQTTVKNPYLSFAFPEAKAKAEEALGTEVILRQDHPEFKRRYK